MKRHPNRFLPSFAPGMAYELVFLDQARNDLRDLFNYLHLLSPRAAISYVDGLEKACDRLRTFPRSGRQYDDRYRVLVYRNHLIFYRISDSSSVHVVTLVDGRRDPSSFFASK